MAKILGHPVLFLFLITLHPAMAEEERLTLEWIFSDDRRLATAAPKHAWLDTGDIVLYDITKKQSERTIELLDPETGQREPLIDPHKAIDNISSILKPEESIEELGWPEAFTPDGYFKTGDKGELVDGYIKITGRIKDIIITSGGKNISPENLENKLKFSSYIVSLRKTIIKR